MSGELDRSIGCKHGIAGACTACGEESVLNGLRTQLAYLRTTAGKLHQSEQACLTRKKKLVARIDELAAEKEALREENTRLIQANRYANDVSNQALQERDRLRAALEKIAEVNDGTGRFAKQALSGEK